MTPPRITVCAGMGYIDMVYTTLMSRSREVGHMTVKSCQNQIILYRPYLCHKVRQKESSKCVCVFLKYYYDPFFFKLKFDSQWLVYSRPFLGCIDPLAVKFDYPL